MKFYSALGFALVVLTACADTTVTPVSKNQIMLSTSGDPDCGMAGAQRVASKMAAIETLRRGYSRYVISAADSASSVGAVVMPTTYSPVMTYPGGIPLFYGTNDVQLHVTMFKEGDRGYEQGVDAKSVLGTDWQELVEKGVRSCAVTGG